MHHLETPSRGGHHACTAVTHTPVPANLLDHGGGGGPGVAIWLAGGRRWLAGGRRGPEGGSSQDPSPLLRGFLMSQQNPQGCRPKLAERQLLKPRRLQPRSPDGGPTLHSGLFICLRKSAFPKLKKKFFFTQFEVEKTNAEDAKLLSCLETRYAPLLQSFLHPLCSQSETSSFSPRQQPLSASSQVLVQRPFL